jgi:hypothetical protein
MTCPTLPPEFWPNWIVQLFIALGTVGAVIVALFGDYFRSKLLPPGLRLSVDSLEGIKTPLQLAWRDEVGDLHSRMEDARYWHVRVRNERRWFPAHHVQVLLLQIEEPGPNGAPQIKWAGEAPVLWENQELYSAGRAIGASGRVALCSVVKGKCLALHPLIAPLNMETQRHTACSLILTFQARADEGDSPPLRVRVAWDGKWDDGTQEMRQHLTLETLGAQAD